MNVPPTLLVNVISGAPLPILQQCLDNLAQATCRLGERARVKLLFIDNSGQEAESWVKQSYPAADYLAQTQTKGFATNANLALRSGADYVLLLNNDVFLTGEALPLLLDTLQRHAHWAAISANLRNVDGTAQGTAFRFPTTRSLLRAMAGRGGLCHLHGCQIPVREDDGDIEAGWVPATCMLIRQAAIERIGLFDEGFDPGYGEDMDWCRRAQQAGWKIGVCAQAKVIHVGGASFSALGDRQFALFVRGLCRYLYKYHPFIEASALTLFLSISLLTFSAFPKTNHSRRARTSRQALIAGAKAAFAYAKNSLIRFAR